MDDVRATALVRPRPFRGVVLLGVAPLILAPTVTAQVVSVVEVPAVISSVERARLVGKRNELRGRIDVLNGDIDGFNARCGAVRSDQPGLIQECTSSQGRLNAAQGSLLDATALFRLEVIEVLQGDLGKCQEDQSALDGRMTFTKRDLTRYTRNHRAEELDAWAQLPLAARAEARRAAVDAVVSVALQGLTTQNASAREITGQRLTDIQTRLRDFGPVLDRFEAGTVQRLASLRTDAEVLQALGEYKSLLDVSELATSNAPDGERALVAVAQLLDVFVQTPTLKLLLTNVNLWESVLYAGLSASVARERVQQLVELSELDLRAVESLSALYARQVESRMELRQRCDQLSAALGAFGTV